MQALLRLHNLKSLVADRLHRTLSCTHCIPCMIVCGLFFASRLSQLYQTRQMTSGWRTSPLYQLRSPGSSRFSRKGPYLLTNRSMLYSFACTTVNSLCSGVSKERMTLAGHWHTSCPVLHPILNMSSGWSHLFYMVMEHPASSDSFWLQRRVSNGNFNTSFLFLSLYLSFLYLTPVLSIIVITS